MPNLSMSIDADTPLRLEPGGHIFISLSSNVSATRELVWPGVAGEPLVFRPEPDWLDDSYTVRGSDPRGGHLADHSEWKATMLESERARAAKKMAAQINARQQRRQDPRISLHAFQNGRERAGSGRGWLP